MSDEANSGTLVRNGVLVGCSFLALLVVWWYLLYGFQGYQWAVAGIVLVFAVLGGIMSWKLAKRREKAALSHLTDWADKTSQRR